MPTVGERAGCMVFHERGLLEMRASIKMNGGKPVIGRPFPAPTRGIMADDGTFTRGVSSRHTQQDLLVGLIRTLIRKIYLAAIGHGYRRLRIGHSREVDCEDADHQHRNGD